MTIWYRTTTTCLAALVFVIAGAGTAAAQFPNAGPGTNPANSPAVSPYLNLLRRGNSPGVNYYGLVKPEMEFRNAYRGLQQQLTLQQNTLQTTDPQTGLPYTGHLPVFLNTGGYFLNLTPGVGQGQTQARMGVGQTRPGGAAGMGQLAPAGGQPPMPPTRGVPTPRR